MTYFVVVMSSSPITDYKKNVLITGPTGMIGSIILRKCLYDDDIGQVVAITRNDVGIRHHKLRQVIHRDFNHFDKISEYLKGVDIVYYCLGVYTGQVPDEKFREITVDYTRALADIVRSHSPQTVFCFLSGAGADQKEKSRVPFARYKGMAENHLIGKHFRRLHIFRPGYIYPVEKRKEPNIAYRAYRVIYPVVKMLGNGFSIPSTDLASAMFLAGKKDAGKMVLENKDIVEMAGVSRQ